MADEEDVKIEFANDNEHGMDARSTQQPLNIKEKSKIDTSTEKFTSMGKHASIETSNAKGHKKKKRKKLDFYPIDGYSNQENMW
jgi:hypothetical protein